MKLYTFILGTIMSLISQATLATTWSLSGDYSATENPSGQWSYGYTIGNLTADPNLPFHLFDSKGNFNGFAHQYLAGTGLPSVGQAFESNVFDVPIGAVMLHPGNIVGLTDYSSVVAWTAARDGIYSVNGLFKTVDTRGPNVETLVIANGTVEYDSFLIGTGTEGNFDFQTSLTKGSTLYFAVSNHGAVGDMNWTLADAMISEEAQTSIPEPGTNMMVFLGVAILILVRQTGRKYFSTPRSISPDVCTTQ